MSEQKKNNEIRALMVRLGINQEEMAKRLGLGVSTFNRKLNGNAPWKIEEGKKIASILGTTLEEIFCD
ncbi:MAG: helix-turn-helix transcriptional regulator [Peptococcales bacterium]|jgi:DNA-binding XRE family transcriptional regulator